MDKGFGPCVSDGLHVADGLGRWLEHPCAPLRKLVCTCGTESPAPSPASLLEPKGGSAAAAVTGKQMLILMQKPA